MKTKTKKILSVIGLIAATATIIFDFFIPTLVILTIIFFLKIIDKTFFKNLGLKNDKNWLQMATKVFLLSIFWTILTLGVTLPILMRLTGQQQDLSQFLNLKGNTNQLLLFLTFTWTLAAFGEEVVYRGFILENMLNLSNINKYKIPISIIFSSLLFGIAHTEQGLIGILVTFIDAIYFCLIKRYFNNNLWASVLAHGFNNTIGIVGFYLLGPIYSLW